MCGCGLAGVDGFGAEDNAFLQVASQSCSDQRGGGVEQDNVAARAGNAGEHVIEQRLVGLECRRR